MWVSPRFDRNFFNPDRSINYAGTKEKQVSPLAVASLRNSVEMTIDGGGVINAGDQQTCARFPYSRPFDKLKAGASRRTRRTEHPPLLKAQSRRAKTVGSSKNPLRAPSSLQARIGSF